MSLKDDSCKHVQTHKLIVGHVLDALKSLPDGSVDLVMTSPPYWSLRDYGPNCRVIWGGDKKCQHEWISHIEPPKGGYAGGSFANRPSKQAGSIAQHQSIMSQFCSKCGGWQGQLGLEPTFQLYLDHLTDVFGEVKRVLKKTGSFYLNIGDTYSCSPVGRLTGGGKEFEGRDLGGIATSGSINKSKSGVPAKCLIGVPERLMLRLVDEQGWIRRNTIIWEKPNHMPSSVKDRLANSFEYLYHFVKSQKYFYDLDAIREPQKFPEDVARRIRQDREDGIVPFAKGDPEVKWRRDLGYQGKFDGFAEDSEAYGSPRARTQRKQDNIPGRNAPMYDGFNDRWGQKYSKGEQNGVDPRYPSGSGPMSWKAWKENHPSATHLLGKNPGDVWRISTQSYREAHFATYPEELCRRPILSSCPKDGVVLDPFGGSGTTAKVARDLGRSSICIEINPDYEQLWRSRLGGSEGFGVKYEVEKIEC